MGKNAVSVGNNSKENSEMSRNLAWADRGGKPSALSPAFRHILTGLSVGQMIMVAVSAVTLGTFVNSNVRMVVYFTHTI